MCVRACVCVCVCDCVTVAPLYKNLVSITHCSSTTQAICAPEKKEEKNITLPGAVRWKERRGGGKGGGQSNQA